MKPNFLLSISLLICCFLSCADTQSDSSKATEAILYIPQNAAFIVEGRNLLGVKDEVVKADFQSLSPEKSELSSFFTLLSELEQELNTNQSSLWRNYEFCFSIHSSGSQKTGSILVLKDKSKQLLKAIYSSFNDDQKSIEQYENKVITKLKSETLACVQINDFMLISDETILIKDAILQHSAKSNLKTNPHFQKVFKSADRDEMLNIYIQSQSFFEVLSMDYTIDLGTLSELDEWMALDLDLDKNRMVLTGICNAKEGNRLDKMKFGTSGKPSTIFDYLPAQTALVYSHLFADMQQLYSAQIKRIEKQQQLDTWKKIKKENPFSVDQFMDDVDDEFGIAQLNVDHSEQVVFIKLKAFDFVRSLLEDSELEPYRAHEIKQLKSKGIWPYLFSEQMAIDTLTKALILDNYLILANHQNQIKQLINSYLLNEILSQNDGFKNLKHELSDKTNLWFYASEKALEHYPKAHSKSKKNTLIFEKKLSKLGKILAQVQVEDHYFQINIAAKNPSKQWEKPARTTNWTLGFEHEFSSEFYSIWNDKSKAYDLMVQDEKNTLFRLSREGKILWQKPMDQRIINIEAIDVYKNGRIQSLIQTKDNLFLYDKNGKIVTGYPVSLPSESTAKLAVFDYKSNRDYRILVPCKTHLAMFNQLGKRVQGWKAYKQKYAIDSQPIHHQAYGKDFIVCSNANDEILVLKRAGTSRFEVKKRVKTHPKTQWFAKRNAVEFNCRNTDGQLVTVMNQGLTETTKAEQKEPLAFFDQEDLQLSVGSSALIARYHTKAFSHSFENSKSEIFLDRAAHFIAVSDKQNEEVYVFDLNTGEQVEKSPFYGNSRPKLMFDEKKNLLHIYVGGSDGTLYAYQLLVE
ncbi:MAG: DUF3352 domain-containing protein [Flavobacteriales bacterium]